MDANNFTDDIKWMQIYMEDKTMESNVLSNKKAYLDSSGDMDLPWRQGVE